jgi:hypothetical protein
MGEASTHNVKDVTHRVSQYIRNTLYDFPAVVHPGYKSPDTQRAWQRLERWIGVPVFYEKYSLDSVPLPPGQYPPLVKNEYDPRRGFPRIAHNPGFLMP